MVNNNPYFPHLQIEKTAPPRICAKKTPSMRGYSFLRWFIPFSAIHGGFRLAGGAKFHSYDLMTNMKHLLSIDDFRHFSAIFDEIVVYKVYTYCKLDYMVLS